jgi:hypothetical protein
MSRGIFIAPAQYRHMIAGVFAGHVHSAAGTTPHLFTQVPAVTQEAADVAFYVAEVTAESPKIKVNSAHLYPI